MKFSDSKKVNIEYIDVEDNANEDELNAQNERQELDDVESLDFNEEEGVRTRTRRRKKAKKKKTGAGQYGWAFFLASLFTGLGLTATFEHPIFLFLGLGFGFLFFVDPFYDKVMEKFKNL